MRNNLMVIKMSDGSNVLSEVEYIESTYSYRFIMPILYSTSTISGGEITTAMPYLPGAADNVLEIPNSAVITMTFANEFFTKFYGSSLMRFYIQSELQANSLKGGGELDKEALLRLELKKEEILLKFGMIDEPELDFSQKGVIH